MLGTGRETLRTMDQIGYDVAVVGNHDWLNGPDRLLDAYEGSGARMSLVAANIDLKNYPLAERFRRLIPPYVIKQVAGAKIAFIGVVTYEKMYDRFFKPVDIDEPYLPIAKLASSLKKSVDAVVAISHNSVGSNKILLETARDVDLVIGAHDHVKLTEPVQVSRPMGTTAWIVETGCWGRYVGQVELSIEPRSKNSDPTVNLLKYGLTQMDSTIPEDPAMLAQVKSLEKELESLYHEPLFHDHVADLDGDITRDGSEPLMGDLAVDSYREATGAEISFEEVQFVYGELHPGKQRSVDFLNAAPGIYDPTTAKSWTLHLLPMSGKSISNLLSLFYSSKTAANSLGIAAAGIQMTYSPLADDLITTSVGFSVPFPGLQDTSRIFADEKSIVQDLRINGVPIDPAHQYLAAIGGGTIDAFEFLNSESGLNLIPLDQLKDTGLEVWRTLASYVSQRTPFHVSSIPQGNRMRSAAPDLSVRRPDIQLKTRGRTPEGRLMTQVTVTVRNFGAKLSPAGVLLETATRTTGINTGVTPAYQGLGQPVLLPEIAPGASFTTTFDLELPGERGIYPLEVFVTNNESEVVHSNDAVDLWLTD
jgi:hypothetical protein